MYLSQFLNLRAEHAIHIFTHIFANIFTICNVNYAGNIEPISGTKRRAGSQQAVSEIFLFFSKNKFVFSWKKNPIIYSDTDAWNDKKKKILPLDMYIIDVEPQRN